VLEIVDGARALGRVVEDGDVPDRECGDEQAQRELWLRQNLPCFADHVVRGQQPGGPAALRGRQTPQDGQQWSAQEQQRRRADRQQQVLNHMRAEQRLVVEADWRAQREHEEGEPQPKTLGASHLCGGLRFLTQPLPAAPVQRSAQGHPDHDERVPAPRRDEVHVLHIMPPTP